MAGKKDKDKDPNQSVLDFGKDARQTRSSENRKTPSKSKLEKATTDPKLADTPLQPPKFPWEQKPQRPRSRGRGKGPNTLNIA